MVVEFRSRWERGEWFSSRSWAERAKMKKHWGGCAQLQVSCELVPVFGVGRFWQDSGRRIFADERGKPRRRSPGEGVTTPSRCHHTVPKPWYIRSWVPPPWELQFWDLNFWAGSAQPFPGCARVPWAGLVPELEALQAGKERASCERWASAGSCVQSFAFCRELLQCHGPCRHFSCCRSCLHSFLMLGLLLLTPLPYLSTLRADQSKQGVLFFQLQKERLVKCVASLNHSMTCLRFKWTGGISTNTMAIPFQFHVLQPVFNPLIRHLLLQK